MARCFGTLTEPDGIGSTAVNNCSVCFNSECAMVGKKIHLFCNDFMTEEEI